MMLKTLEIVSDPLSSNSVKSDDSVLQDMLNGSDFSVQDSVSLPEASTSLGLNSLSMQTFDINSSSDSNPSDLDSSGLDLLDSDLLELSDATSSDLLFDLGESNLGVTGTSSNYTLRSMYDPIDYGDPLTDSAYWRYQSGNASCAVVAQISVYESLTGGRISETSASNYAQSQGWFNPQTGTPLSYAGSILNVLGIATYGGYNKTLNYLASALAKGDKPIVGLDANEIWYPQRDRYGNPVEQRDAGHAVWVTGIDVKLNGGIDIILNDSGTPNGKSEVVSYANFNNAWQDLNYFVTIADNPFV
jgi:hypothetical protein